MAANSGNLIIDTAFDWAVHALYWTAGVFETSYEAINFWVFCVSWPVSMAALVWLAVDNMRLRRTSNGCGKNATRQRTLHGAKRDFPDTVRR